MIQEKYFGTKGVPAVSMNLPEQKKSYILVPETLLNFTTCLIYDYFIKGLHKIFLFNLTETFLFEGVHRQNARKGHREQECATLIVSVAYF